MQKARFVSLLILGVLAQSFVFSATSFAQLLPEKPFSQEGIPGRSAKAISIAIPELSKYALDIEKYKVIVSEERDVVYVTFIDAEAFGASMRGHRGSVGKFPAFTVMLSKDTLQIIQSHFVR